MGEHYLAELLKQLLRRWFPLPPGYETEGPSLDELKPKYWKWEYYSQILIIVTTVPLTYVLSCLLVPLQEWNTARYGPADFHLYFTPSLMNAPAMIIGFAMSWPALSLIYWALLRDRFVLYVRYSNLEHDIDVHRVNRRVFRPLFWFVLAVGVAVVPAIMNCHVVLDRKEVRFESWFGLVRSTHPYSAVKDICTAPMLRRGSQVVPRREWIVEFGDGLRWQIDFSDITDKTKKAIATYVSQRSGKPIRELEILE